MRTERDERTARTMPWSRMASSTSAACSPCCADTSCRYLRQLMRAQPPAADQPRDVDQLQSVLQLKLVLDGPSGCLDRLHHVVLHERDEGLLDLQSAIFRTSGA